MTAIVGASEIWKWGPSHVFVRVERASGDSCWYSDRIGEVFMCTVNDGGVFEVTDKDNDRVHLIQPDDGCLVEPAIVVARPGLLGKYSDEYKREVETYRDNRWISKSSVESKAVEADRQRSQLERYAEEVLEDRFNITARRLESHLSMLKTDLCAHSIATRRADDDLADRIGRLESAHQATVPVDAMRRLIEWAYLHQLSSPRKWDRLQDTINEVLTWSPEIGVFTFSSNGGFFWQDYAPKETEG